MATERTVAPMASFFKFTKIGQSIAGLISKYATNEQGGFIVLRPALIREDRASAYCGYDGAAVGLATDIRLKITDKDTNKYVRIEFVDKEPTKKGSPRKIFRVELLERAELIALARDADMSNRDKQYAGRAGGHDDEMANEAAEEQDDLPF